MWPDDHLNQHAARLSCLLETDGDEWDALASRVEAEYVAWKAMTDDASSVVEGF